MSATSLHSLMPCFFCEGQKHLVTLHPKQRRRSSAGQEEPATLQQHILPSKPQPFHLTHELSSKAGCADSSFPAPTRPADQTWRLRGRKSMSSRRTFADHACTESYYTRAQARECSAVQSKRRGVQLQQTSAQLNFLLIFLTRRPGFSESEVLRARISNQLQLAPNFELNIFFTIFISYL